MSFSPIMEQSPADETAVSQPGPPPDRLGTIVGEGLCSASSTTLVQAPPPGVLSFRDQTVCTRTTLDPEPERPPEPKSPSAAKSEPFQILEDLEDLEGAGQDPVCDVSMSPAATLQPDWLNIRSPEAPPQTDLDAFLSPCRLKTADVPMTPEPAMALPTDATASPDRGQCCDVSMNSATPIRGCGPSLVSNPWDDQLISHMLSALTPPLSSHPHYITWTCTLPAISPRTTISMGTVAPALKPLPCSAFHHLLAYRKRVSASGLRPRGRRLRHRVPGHRPCERREGGAEGMRGRSHATGPAGAEVFSVSVPCGCRCRNRPIPGSFTSTRSWTRGCSPPHATSSATSAQLTCSTTAAFCSPTSTNTAPCWFVSAGIGRKRADDITATSCCGSAPRMR